MRARKDRSARARGKKESLLGTTKREREREMVMVWYGMVEYPTMHAVSVYDS